MRWLAAPSRRQSRTVGDEAAEVAAHNAMPCRALALVKLDGVRSRAVDARGSITSRLMYWAMSCAGVSQPQPTYRTMNDLFYVELAHGILG